MEMAVESDITSNGYTKGTATEQTPLFHVQEGLNISRRTMGDTSESVVESLLREKPGDTGPMVEVKWKGWNADDNTWEPRSQLLEDVPDMVAELDSRVRAGSQEPAERTPQSQDADDKISAQTSTTGDISMANSDSTPDPQPPTQSADWTGWAELENDPLIFSTLLREWGVQGVSVREVIPLDSIFDTPVASTLGLIFLSRYIVFDPDSETSTSTPSPTLWFANQISSFSCATVALMNIINNRPLLSLGPSLQAFKSHTATLSPKDRGLALDALSPIRAVHNSFATFADKLHVDARLRDDARSHAAKSRAQARWKGKPRKPRKSISTDDDESGLHFVAFVPAEGHLWRLDGLERSPTSIGRITDAENWLTMVVPVLEAQFNAAAMNELEFSLLSVVLTEPGMGDEKDEERTRRVREDWGPMMATMVRIHAEKGDLKEKLG
jgi:hypothetical protein